MANTVKISVIFSFFILFCFFSRNVYADCAEDIIGKWQQTHVILEGNKFEDDTQAWEFRKNGTVRFTKKMPPNVPGIDASGNYSCEGDIIYMKGKLPGRLKIVEYDGERMVWEALDHGGGVTYIKRVK